MAERQAPRHNDAGLLSLRYRAGTHSSFKANMLAALGTKPLARLTTRKDDDPSVALLDAWAVVLDVLTFYQERIANEGYLRTAGERRSLLELARAIGYELNPGVAASAYLVFSVSELPGSPLQITVPAATRVQSMPAEDELPQTFETVEPLDARTEWNALRPRIAPLAPAFGMGQLHVRGVSSRIAKGDLLLVIGDEGEADPAAFDWDLRRVQEATPVAPASGTADPNAGYTTVTLDHPLGRWISQNGGGGPLEPGGGIPGGPRDETGPVDLPDIDIKPAPYRRTNARIYVFRQVAALFGHNAPDWRSMSERIQTAYGDTNDIATDWPRFNAAYADKLPNALTVIHLDAVYPKIVADDWVALGGAELFRVQSVSEKAKADFTLTAKTSCLTLDRDVLGAGLPPGLRETLVFAQAESLEFAPNPASPAVAGRSVTLDRAIGLIAAGRPIAVTGRDAVTGESASEVVFLSSAAQVGAYTQLLFATDLRHRYAADSLTLHANVALATHGQSSSEILGSGNASLAFQKFGLKQKPLGYVPAANAAGGASTLVVRVNGITWSEVASLHECGPDDRVYTIRIEDEGTAVVQFGDGVTGARVPSGAENVVASYRVGLGTAGLIDGGRINMLLTRPLGLESAVNPVASDGGADPQTLDEARQHAPLTVLTLDRIVSLQDFEDFAGAFAGIGKAQASLVWNGQRRVVHLTLGGVAGAAVDASSSLLANLRAAIDAARQTDQPVQIDSYRALGFLVAARVTVDPRYLAADVLSGAAAALIDAFAFERRGFAQPVSKSHVLAVLQAVPGVVAIDLDALHITSAPSSLATTLPARRARFESGAIEPAELLTLAPEDVVLLEA